MRRSYLDYAMSVIVARALPDVRDGLKPVHRRILYAMQTAATTADRPYRKSAQHRRRGDGQVPPARRQRDLRRAGAPGAGLLHAPAADRRAGQFRLDGRRSAGGDALHRGAAGARRRGAADDIDKETVDFQPNYDDQSREPTVLPARFPNLLVNGASGIAVGMATNIPTAQSRRGHRRLLRLYRQSRDHHRRADADHARPGFPDRRHRAEQQDGAARGLPHRPRLDDHARHASRSRSCARTARRSSSPRCPTR